MMFMLVLVLVLVCSCALLRRTFLVGLAQNKNADCMMANKTHHKLTKYHVIVSIMSVGYRESGKSNAKYH